MKKDVRKTELVKTAIELFGKCGYDMVTMQQIADEAKIQAMQLYRDFNGKEELLDAVLDYFKNYFQHYRLTADEIILKLELGKSPEEILTQFVAHYDQYCDKMSRHLVNMVFRGMYSSKKILEAGVKVLFETPAANVAYTLKVLAWLGEIPPCDYENLSKLWAMTWVIFGFIDPIPQNGTAMEMFRGCMDVLIQMAVRGLKPPDVEVVLKWNEHLLAKELEIPDTDTKQKILRESLRLFSEKGHNGVTNKDIADAVGLQSASALYRHFQSKGDIMDALIERQMLAYARYDASRPQWRGVIKGGSREQLTLYLYTTHPPIKEEHVLHTYRLLFRHRYFNNVQIKEFFNSMVIADCELVANFLEDCVATGTIPQGPMRSIAMVFIFSVCGLTLAQTVIPEKSKQYEAVRGHFLRLIASFVSNGFLNNP